MPVAFRLDLVPQENLALLGAGGEAAHGLVFGILLAGDARYAATVHKAQHKPFVLSPLEGLRQRNGSSFAAPGERVGCRVSFLEDRAVGVFARGLGKGGHRLGGSRVDVTDCQLEESTTYEALWACEGSATRVALRFLSPMALKRDGADAPFPGPEAVAASLLLRWNAFAPEALRLSRDLLKGPGLRLWRYQGRSVPLRLSWATTLGFVGLAEYALPREEEQAHALAALLRFATFAGVGRRTALGMGWTQVEWVAPRDAKAVVRAS